MIIWVSVVLRTTVCGDIDWCFDDLSGSHHHHNYFTLLLSLWGKWKFKEAHNSFFGLGVYLLKSNFRLEDKLRFSWYYTTFSTYEQSLFSHWFPSKSCHHSNSNGQPLILNNVEYLENYSDTLWRNLNYLNYSTYTTCVRN